MSTRNINGFSFVEMLVTLAIVAILAAIAYPTYKNYVIRSYLIEYVGEAQSLKVDVNKRFVAKTTMPTTAELAGLGFTNSDSVVFAWNYLTATTGRITIAIPSNTKYGDASGNTINLNVTATNGVLNWDCVAPVALAKVLPTGCTTSS